MKRVYVSVLTAMIFLASIAACQKGGGGGNGDCSETAMTITTSPAINSTEAPSAGETFPLTVNISANLPNAGATIAVKARPESSQTAFYTETKTTTAAVNSFTITGTPVGTPCVVEITVTSKSCAKNTFSGLYRYSRK